MTKLTAFLLALLAATAACAQTTVRLSAGENGTLIADRSSDLTLPLNIIFPPGYRDHTVDIRDSAGQALGLDPKRLGAGFPKDGESGAFVILIDAQRKLQPGSASVAGNSFELLYDDNKKLSFQLRPAASGGSGGGNAGPPAAGGTLGSYEAGRLYYDAIRLSEEGQNSALVLSILKAYGLDIDSRMDNNPYLSEYFPEYKATASMHQSATPAALLGSLGNADVTNLASGLARFLAERAKAELNEAFFSRMKTELMKYPELKTVFPKTTSFLDIIDSYAYSSVIQVLKEAFETDMENLPANLYALKALTPASCPASLSKNDARSCQSRLTGLQDFFQKSREGKWVGLGLYAVKDAVSAPNPAVLLSDLSGCDELRQLHALAIDQQLPDHYNLASTLQLISLVSESLRSKEEGQVWVSTQEFGRLFRNERTFKIYLGLLLAREQNGSADIRFLQDTVAHGYGEFLRNVYRNYNTQAAQLGDLVRSLYSSYQAANNAVRKLLAAADKVEAADPQAIYQSYRLFVSALSSAAHNPLLNTYLGERCKPAPVFDQVVAYLDPAVDIAYHVSVRKYSAAVYDVTALLKNFEAGESGLLRSFVRYGTAISTVATAQSSDEVKAAIQASALPVGSASIKRKTRFSISVNGYVGGFWGEAHSTVTDTVFNAAANHLDSIERKSTVRGFGLYAPVGVSFNGSLRSGWGLTVSAQLIDLGALVNFYVLEGDRTALPSDFGVRLSNIVAPGVQLGLNIPNTPLTFMGGFQYVPALYKKEQVTGSEQTIAVSATRWQLSLVVDIPLYNLRVWEFRK
ncbi:hypothetical protein [Flaviaesturariibacter terrae]